MPAGTSIRVATRVSGFTYAIRNIVGEAKKLEAAGRTVRYLNIGDPIPFGFRTPAPLVEAVTKALRDNQNGYAPSVGIEPARRAVSAEWTGRGMPVSPDRVVITSGTSEGIELALGALADAGDEVLVPTPTYPLYTAVLAKIGARAAYYRTDPSRGWEPDLDDVKRRLSSATRAIVVIDPNNPTGAVYSEATRRALIELAERAGVPILADEVYADLGYDGPTPLLASLAPDAAILSFSSLSKGFVAPGWRAGWLCVGRTDRLDDALAAIKKLADGRLCAPGPMQYGIEAALTGDRAHQHAFVHDLRVRADLTMARLGTIPGLSCVAPRAAFYVMPKVALPPGTTDEDFVIGLLRATGILCVYGSGFGMPADQGFFRMVFLASPDALGAIYDDLTTFTADFSPIPGLARVIPQDTREHRLMVYAIAAMLVGAVALWGLYLLRGVLLLVYVSTLLAIGLSPVVHSLERLRIGKSSFRRISRGTAILILYVLVVAFTGLLAAIIVPPLVGQSRELWQALPQILDRVQHEFIMRGWLHQKWTWGELIAKLPGPEFAFTSLVGVFESAIGALAGLATVAVLPYYLLVEADDLQDGFLRFVPVDRRARLERVTDDVTLKVGAWLGSQMLLCVIIGALASLSLWLIGVPYFYVLGLIAGLGELVPVVGPLLAALPAVIMGWTVSSNVAILVVAYLCAQQVFENYVLIPSIMQKRVGVSAVTVIVALLIGTELLGVVGALLAVPTAAIVQVLLNEYLSGETS